MLENQDFRPAAAIGPLGELLTLDTLPPRDLQRWTPRRKAEVVAAVRGGLFTVSESCDRYGISLEEFVGWQRSVERSGMLGLRVTRVQHYRDKYARLGLA
jgi:hypothetical protein